MKLPFVVFFGLFLYAIVQIVGADDASPVVCFGRGCVRGKTFKGNLKEFEGFLGIPFAKPPVGELRLKVSLLHNAPHLNLKFIRRE